MNGRLIEMSIGSRILLGPVLLWSYVAWIGIRYVAQGCRVSVAMDVSLWKRLRVIVSNKYPVSSLPGQYCMRLLATLLGRMLLGHKTDDMSMPGRVAWEMSLGNV
jgi:hypothetical protein